jgi:hypothetical protein
MIISTGSVDHSVPVVTVVHDCQVLDLPDDLFSSHDVPVDYIVTPTRVIKCADYHSPGAGSPPAKPAGLIWSLLNDENLRRIPVLRRLRYREWKAGKDVHLNGEGPETALELTDVVESEDFSKNDKRKERNRRGPRRSDRSRLNGSESAPIVDAVEKGANDVDQKPAENKRFSGNRRSQAGRLRKNSDRRRDRTDESERRNKNGPANGADTADNQSGDGYQGDSGVLKERAGYDGKGESSDGKAERNGRRRNDFQGAVYVGALPRSVRVSEFKAEVRERKVNPLRVLWRGSSGFAFLNFKTVEDAETALEALSGLQVSVDMYQFYSYLICSAYLYFTGCLPYVRNCGCNYGTVTNTVCHGNCS